MYSSNLVHLVMSGLESFKQTYKNSGRRSRQGYLYRSVWCTSVTHRWIH